MVYANIAFCHLALGDRDAAETFHERASAIYADSDLLAERIRIRWIFAQLLVARGDVEDGLANLESAAAEYHAAGMVTHAAAIDLERVEILLGADAWAEAEAIAVRLVNVYQRSGQRLSHVRALSYLRDAVKAAAATPELARYVKGYVAETREQPFRPPATSLPS